MVNTFFPKQPHLKVHSLYQRRLMENDRLLYEEYRDICINGDNASDCTNGIVDIYYDMFQEQSEETRLMV